MKTKLLNLIFLLVFYSILSPNVDAQIKLKDVLKKKKEEKVAEKPTTNPNANPNSNKPSINTNPVVIAPPSKLEEVKQARAQLEKGNIVKFELFESGKGTKEEVNAFLTFTSDYAKPSEDKIEFGGKDFVYARLQLPKKLTEYLPAENDDNLQYYRIKIFAKVDDGVEKECDLKLSKKNQFKLAYNANEIIFPIIPEKGFYENILAPYKKSDKFPSPMEEQKAYQAALAYNMPWELLEAFKDAPNGSHRADIFMEITAKLRGSDAKIIRGIKGVFAFTMDDETRERYQATYELMSEHKLANEYWGYESIAGQTIGEAKEAEMLKSMSPRDQERYKIAKRTPDGYMGAYDGPKAACTFTMDASRSKTAVIDITWNDGGLRKEAGNHTFSLTPNAGRSKTKSIPIGAKVSINGRVLIPSVAAGQNITIYWYY